MGKYTRFQRKAPGKKALNPIWRGIGCILIIVVPLLAFWMMLVLVPPIIATGKVPYQLVGRVHFPEWAFKFKIVGLVATFISSIDNLWISIITFFVMLVILTGFMSLPYAILYSLIGPARYTEMDAPPTKHKVKKYTR